MKVSVSLPREDLEFLDEYARERGLESRSAAVRQAIRSLQVAEMSAAYETAWREWNESGDERAWEPTTRDGLPA
jgi:Arc/MetJ-type ribon-helix-helix transcriptional regulator